MNTIDRRCVPSPTSGKRPRRTARNHVRLPLRLERAVEPRRAHDRRRRGRPARARAARAARPRASSARSPGTGSDGDASSKRSSGVGLAPNGEFDDTWTNRRGAGAAGPVEGELGAADVDVEELADARRGGSRPAAWNTVAAPTPSKSRSSARRVADVADDDLDVAADELEQRRLGVGRGTRHRTRARAGARARTRFCPSHPAAPVTTTVVGAGASLGRSGRGVIRGWRGVRRRCGRRWS